MVANGVQIEAPRFGAAGACGWGLIGFAWVLTWYALGHLGRQWRVRAVVTDDHKLITTGPYRFLRHPIYTGFLAMVIGTAMLVSPAWSAMAAVALFIAGTEIRVHVEDALLLAHFPDTFPAYRASARAYLPAVR